ncbi:ABC transporter ATP-binding protein [Propionibacterium freudenreichii]|uniref:ABC transporter ATP-binding protein n=1 Tax=Propionibacterium freudenreichii TaxID=1744 RepID=UPI00071120C2|nr:ABC transporter ATP-binding protein [Propionibacterium freudenreichii]MDK9675511.1 ABC transporter ATP-binding protein [Propionibacterium freudenreichii]SCQ47326.1 Daunorubicin resistance ABC transporter ATPase subunit [Propionibacterium freudenreichii]SCQ55198.1 Daunorubicin resistance ABC transporter ATPase subunit [Propionibacterium freudenreichii]
MSVIEVSDLHRDYETTTGVFRRQRKLVNAVRGVSFRVERGDLFGLLGPNGAGKTTIIKVLITLLLPSAGFVRVLGHDVTNEFRAIRRNIGFVFGGDRGLYERLSALDNLRYFAELFEVDVRTQRRRIPELFETVGLKGHEGERVETFSRGMKQRLHIARGLVHDPELLFLDEPSIGIDPVGAHELRAMISRLREQGKTILLTTHYMFEADELCNKLGILAKGKLISLGSPSDLKASIASGHVLEVELFGAQRDLTDRIGRIQGVRSVTLKEDKLSQTLTVQISPGNEVTSQVLGAIADHRIGRVSTREPTLEDAYIELVSHNS